MQYRRRLRSRIVLSFLLFGTLLSALFALSTLFLQNYLEDQLIGATLKQELDDYVNRVDAKLEHRHYDKKCEEFAPGTRFASKYAGCKRVVKRNPMSYVALRHRDFEPIGESREHHRPGDDDDVSSATC